jgi:hypothetical protein
MPTEVTEFIASREIKQLQLDEIRPVKRLRTDSGRQSQIQDPTVSDSIHQLHPLHIARDYAVDGEVLHSDGISCPPPSNILHNPTDVSLNELFFEASHAHQTASLAQKPSALDDLFLPMGANEDNYHMLPSSNCHTQPRN